MNLLELIGVAAFAVTGATAGIEKGTDVFGVLFLSLITALGGGIIRDVLLGSFPPRMFTSYKYVIAALLCGLAVFAAAYFSRERYVKNRERFDRLVNVFDAVGLGVFTVSGVQVAADMYGPDYPLLLVLMGMTTGVGGGMLRDVLIGTVPKVLRKRVYAVASLAGALGYYVLLRLGLPQSVSAAAISVFIVVLRFLATYFEWNLPSARL